MYMITGSPLKETDRQKLQLFLASCNLDTDPALDFSVLLMEDDQIIATGSLCGDTIRCVAVSPSHQGEDLTARVMTALMQRASSQGLRHLMLYTKPHNQMLFAPFGFHPVIRTDDCLLMENKRDGLKQYLSSLQKPDIPALTVGSIVMHANPFTFGHRYLIETAARECQALHVFVLSEDRALFTARDRLQMVKAGCRDLSNVFIHPTGPYMISSATFPSYFLKDKTQAENTHCRLDVQLFCRKIAPALQITRRYVGTEPDCPVTAQYNDMLRRLLPEYGLQLIEIPRKEILGRPVSASRVRALIAENNFSALSEYLPLSTIEVLDAIKGERSCRIPSECRKT